jgi:hypothetical protein
MQYTDLLTASLSTILDTAFSALLVTIALGLNCRIQNRYAKQQQQQQQRIRTLPVKKWISKSETEHKHLVSLE